MIRWERTGKRRHKVRTWMIRLGITLLVVCGAYLLAGLLEWVPLELTRVTWNNLRIVSGGAIFGCLLAALGYGNE